MIRKKIRSRPFCDLIITTPMKSFIINYDFKYKIISLNTSINFEKSEKVVFAKNINDIIIIVSNINIYIYQNYSKLILESKIKINWGGIIPLLAKYNKNIKGLFVCFNNNNLMRYNIDIKQRKIIEKKIILNNISISAFDICEKFLIFSSWDIKKLGIYSFSNKRMNYIDLIEDYLNFAFISSIQIIKINEEYNIFLSLSFGKLILLKLNKQINTYEKDYEFKNNDFFHKHILEH